MSMNFDTRIGAERLQLAVFHLVYTKINTYVADEQTYGATIDAALASFTSETLSTPLEQYEPRNIHYGHKPSMIDLPAERFPNISVMSWMASQAMQNRDIDYGFSFQIMCSIETTVKAGPYAIDGSEDEHGEGLVGRRIKRHAEAVNRLMMDNRSLNGMYLAFDQAPRVDWGGLWARDDDTSKATSRYFFQGVRMEYVFTKQAVFEADNQPAPILLN